MKKFFPKLAIIATVFLSGYTVKAQTNVWLPDDFNPKTSILLVQKISRSKAQEKSLENYLKENYPFKYELIDEKEIADPSVAYTDTKTYSFILLNEVKTKTRTLSGSQPTGVQASYNQMIFLLHFYDRNGRIHYPAFDNGNSLKSPLKKIIEYIVEKSK
jgi:hypothetical protein